MGASAVWEKDPVCITGPGRKYFSGGQNRKMGEALLSIRNLHAYAQENEILKGVDLTIEEGQTHVLMGPNGAGKSTLGNAIMGNPAYQVTEGEIYFGGKNIMDLSVNERAKEGIFLSFQNPIEIPGVTIADFLRSAVRSTTDGKMKLLKFRKEMNRIMELLQMDPSYADRYVNEGFSGGEKKKAEILQLLMLKPRFAILDETDSGLDVDAVRTVSVGIQEFMKEEGRSLLVITHNAAILSALHVDRTHIIVDGRIVAEGDGTMVDEVIRSGFGTYENP